MLSAIYRSNRSMAALAGVVFGLGLSSMSMALDAASLNLIDAEDDGIKAPLERASALVALEDGAAGADILAAAQGDYATLVETLYGLGYYSATVRIRLDGAEAARIDPFAAPAVVNEVVIDVTPGRRFRFGDAQIAPLAPGTSLPDTLARDEPAFAAAVRQASRQAVRDWREEGHAKVRVADQSVTARHGSARLDLMVRLAPGPKLRFGDVEVTGESDVSAPRVREIAGLPRGEVFSVSDMERAASRLRRSGAFRAVQLVEADQPNADGTLDIDIEVSDRPKRRIGGGVEISSLDGLRLSGFWLHRNLLGGAERLRFDGEVRQIGSADSGADVDLRLRFEKPAVYGPDTRFFAETGFLFEDEPTYEERRVSLTFGAEREFSETLTGSLGIGLTASRVKDRLASGTVTRDLLLFSLPGALTWDKRDDPLDPTSGVYIKLGAKPFREFESSTNGLKLTLDARGYQALGERVVLAGRAQLGSLIGPDARDAPPNDLFYSGGGGTVRGQPYRSLDVAFGADRLGGRNFVGLSGELRMAVNDTIGVVGFADGGFVGRDSMPGADGDWHAGAGLGLRYKTPVGPIRLDVAAPVAGDTGKGVQFYLGIGQAF